MAKDTLVYALEDTTVHLSQGKVATAFGDQEVVVGHSLAKGETVELSKLTDYQQKAVADGEVATLTAVSPSEAKKLQEQEARVQQLLAQARGQSVVTTAGVPEGLDDGSFSDHRVSDAEKIANHVARAEAEAGEAGTGDPVTVATSEEETAPASSGRKTRKLKTDEVQGSDGDKAADAEDDE